MSDPRFWNQEDYEEFYARFETNEDMFEASLAIVDIVTEAEQSNFYYITGEESAEDLE